MGLFVVGFHLTSVTWVGAPDGTLYKIRDFLAHPGALPMVGSLLGIAIAGGMFVVPLYAFLTTTVPKSQTARTVAANNIVNSGAMVVGLADRDRPLPIWRRGRRSIAPRRRHVPGLGLARLEAAQGLRRRRLPRHGGASADGVIVPWGAAGWIAKK